MSEARFRINSENVVHEAVDGEVIAIDLADGSYYSLAGSGPAIWELLAAGGGVAELTAALERRFEAGPGEIEASVATFLAQLGENDLVVPAEPAPRGEVANGTAGSPREPFEPPLFERYTDMKDYFLLDPIHEVSAAGWPKPAE
jgi:hypothetical protein